MKHVNLLILDDKEENIISLSALLSTLEDVRIIGSTNPTEALKICWQDDIAIALVDVHMPEIDGFEFISLLKSNSQTSHITAIMVTADSKDDKDLLKGLKSGAVDYLYKPLDPEITLAKITSIARQTQIQEEIKEKNVALEELQKQLLLAKKETEEARKVKESFLANMSHEIRTPINGIVGILHVLRNTPLNHQQRDWINRLDSASNSLLLIIDDILDISKIDSGMMKIEYETFSIREKLLDIAKLFKIKASSKNIAFETIIDPQLPAYIKSSAIRVQQIIDNFTSNALKFTEAGKITLAVSVIQQMDYRCTIRFTVTDTGIGIKPAALEKIFLAFEQGDDSITKKHGGTGLGLAIVKRLADLLHGKIGVESTYGVGSAFSFQATFEKVDNFKQQEMMDEGATPSPQKFENVRILIAEDNELNSFMLQHILKGWGCEVDVVRNGRMALEHLEQRDYQLIIMDTHMPIMSGFEAIQAIKTNPNPLKAATPIITISASVLPHEQAAAYEAGADSVIGKPFDPNDLYQKIATLISKRP